MPLYSEKFLTELTERNDIVDVVSQYVQLSRHSGSNLFGLCPFHSERTPSFSVSRSKQIYHCFGCGKGGGVINFVMEIENVGFVDAVAILAKRAGMELPEREDDPESRKKERILALNRDAARFYYECLNAPGGSRGKEYMAGRKISRKTATDFGLGFAPDTWDSLRNAMREKQYTDFEMLDAGLVKRGKNGGFYDTFRNRLMFPVIDVRGNVIAFSGRILGSGEPKYLNSPETAVFSKSRNLFALNLAKKSKSDYFLLAEGNVDVVSLHQAGFDSAVASLGTSLTEQQAQLLSRYKNEVIIAYDNDSAGSKATSRAIGLFEKLDVKVRVLRLDGAQKDPDEYIQAKGAEAFRKLIENSENRMEYRLRSIREKYDLTRPEEKAAFAAEAVRLVSMLPMQAERQVYSAVIAEQIGVKADAVLGDVENQRKRQLRSSEKKESRDMINRTANQRKYENPVSAIAEEGIVRLLYLEPSLIRTEGLPAPSAFTDRRLAKLYEQIAGKLRRGELVSTATMGELLESEEMSLLIEIVEEPENLAESAKTLADYLAAMKNAAPKTIQDILAEKQNQEKGKQ